MSADDLTPREVRLCREAFVAGVLWEVGGPGKYIDSHHAAAAMTTRITPERLEEIREDARPGGIIYSQHKWKEDVRALLSHIDAVTRERDEARVALAEIAGAVDEASDDPAEVVKSVIGHMGALRMFEAGDA
jgi:hypothetical protein